MKNSKALRNNDNKYNKHKQYENQQMNNKFNTPKMQIATALSVIKL